MRTYLAQLKHKVFVGVHFHLRLCEKKYINKRKKFTSQNYGILVAKRLCEQSPMHTAVKSHSQYSSKTWQSRTWGGGLVPGLGDHELAVFDGGHVRTALEVHQARRQRIVSMEIIETMLIVCN